MELSTKLSAIDPKRTQQHFLYCSAVMTGRSTKYKPLELNPIIDLDGSRPLRNAELFLRDAHTMLFLPRSDIAALDSGCNYSMLVTLCCLLGGISRTIYPKNLPKDDYDINCFKALFQKMPWGNPRQGWITKNSAANWLYKGFRSPLVHELGTDEGGKKTVKLPHSKYVVGKRGKIPEGMSLLEAINRDEWDKDWPVMYYKDKTRKKVKVCLVGLYFNTRKLIEHLTYDKELLQNSVFPIRKG